MAARDTHLLCLKPQSATPAVRSNQRLSPRQLTLKHPSHAAILPRKPPKTYRMDPLHRFSMLVWLLIRQLRPISPGRLLMPAVFLGSWTVLRAAHMPDPVAFVWAGVLAQAAQIWAVLPVTVWHLSHAYGRAHHGANWCMGILLAVLTFQIWCADPWISQRLVSVYCALYASLMALGVWGDSDVLNRYAPMSEDSDVPMHFRRHLLKLYALFAILVIAVNEALLAINAPISTRVIMLSLLPIVVHYLFTITLLLTSPHLDETDP